MTIEQYFLIGTIFLLGCKTTPQTRAYDKNAGTEQDVAVAEEAWMGFDKSEQVSYVDLYKYGRVKFPGRWKHSTSQPPRYFSYKNSEYHLLTLDIGRLDTMDFYSKGIDKTQLLNNLYEQGTTLWRQRDGQIRMIEENQDYTTAKMTIDSTKQIFYLCGLKGVKTMGLYLVPKSPDDEKNVDLLKQIFKMWRP
jgi:hypothetical protein